MNTYDRRRPEPVAPEQLLQQAGVAAPAARLLAARLAAATTPGRPAELTGEFAALSAFRSAGVVADPSRRASMIKTALAKVLTVKAAAVVAALSAGGVALAATTGVLPNPLRETPVAPTHPAPTPHTGGNGGGPGGSDATPSPSLEGLCTAFLAGAGSEHGKALENPAFTVLITAAGGPDGVEAYCATLQHGRPTDHPTDHPTGRPSAKPSKPTDH